MEKRLSPEMLIAWAEKAKRRNSAGIVIRDEPTAPGGLVVALQNRQGR